MPSFTIAGYVWQILGREAFLRPPSVSSPEKAHLDRVKPTTASLSHRKWFYFISKNNNFVNTYSAFKKHCEIVIWKRYLQNLEPDTELWPWTEITFLQIELTRNLDIVANAVNFTRQYKLQLEKVTDIVFWKCVQNNYKKKTYLKYKLNGYYKKNWIT